MQKCCTVAGSGFVRCYDDGSDTWHVSQTFQERHYQASGLLSLGLGNSHLGGSNHFHGLGDLLNVRNRTHALLDCM